MSKTKERHFEDAIERYLSAAPALGKIAESEETA
jgi:hypothetical protein